MHSVKKKQKNIRKNENLYLSSKPSDAIQHVQSIFIVEEQVPIDSGSRSHSIIIVPSTNDLFPSTNYLLFG